MTRLLALFALVFACSAQGATYYFSDCQAGADPECVPGNNANSGLSPASPKQSISPTLPAGNHIRLYAKGGSWTRGESLRIYMPGSSKNDPNVWDSYTPSWGAGTARPIWTFTGATNGTYGVLFTEGTAPSKDEGYVFRGIELRGPGYVANGKTVKGTGHAGSGIQISNDADHILVDDVVISGFTLGVSDSGTDLNYTPDAGANHKNEYNTVRRSQIFNNKTQGLIGMGWYYVVENNEFDNNGFARPTLDHNVYLLTQNGNSGRDSSGQVIPWGAAHVVVRGNVSRNAALNSSGLCSASSIVGHYRAYDVVIENNTVYEPSAGTGCYGIDMTVLNSTTNPQLYDHKDTTIRGNRVILLGTAGIGITATGCQNCLIENNVIVREGTSGFTGISLEDEDSKSTNGKGGQAIVRNNSMYLNNTALTTTGIRLRNDTVQTNQETVVSNLIYFGADSPAGATCFTRGSRVASSFAAWSHNLCYRAGGNTWSAESSTLLIAQGLEFDASSLTSNPLLVATPSLGNGWSMAVGTGSPAINAGHATRSSRRALDSKVPVGARDIGAFDFGATVVAPATPTRLQIN